MSNINTVAAVLANTTKTEFICLEQFAWLIDNAGDERSAIRLAVLWRWANEMTHFQLIANQSGEPVPYYQRGETLRVLYPQTDTEVA